ncbi:Protein NLP5 [Linum perenne]
MDGSWQSGMLLGSLADTAMDFDYMDELLLDGCWLETTDGSDFFNPPPAPSDFAATFHPSTVSPALAISNVDISAATSQRINDEEGKQMSVFMGNNSNNNPSQNELQARHGVVTESDKACCVSGRENDDITEGSAALSQRWWIGPIPNSIPGSTVKDRLVGAIGSIRDLIKDKDALVQIWVPMDTRMGRRVLTTFDQPFAVDGSSQRLAYYRNISINYQFPAEEGESKDFVGMPGRVFLGKVPEWTPDVRFFRNDEYPRVDHARQYNVCGTLAVPVFEQRSKTCLGVIEIVTTRQEVKYQSELEKISKALEAVDLRSSETPSTQSMKKLHDMAYQAAIPEIQQVLKSACETHNLPLAQTWIPCIQQGKGGSRHSDENYFHCVSTVDQACFISDPQIKGFHEACSEHHLLKGQGVAGRAFTTNEPCYSSDVTCYSKTEYPLSHHARMFGLCAAVAIRLRSVHTGAADFVLEFFLPADCRTPEKQEKMLNSLSVIIQQVCQTLRVVTDKELEEEADSVVFRPVDDVRSSPETSAGDHNCRPAGLTDVQQCGITVPSAANGMELLETSPDQKGSIENDGEFGGGGLSSPIEGKQVDRKRTKAEKKITLDVLRQHFAGSLKDAAKSLGVCPTTLKRICRQHGISRWPSRKLKKVGHSLQKLQVVMDSVQGASGALHIRSFYTNFPELGSPQGSKSCSPLPASKLDHNPEEPSATPPDATTKSTSSSSCSQGSSSSHSLSSGSQQQQQSTTECPVLGEELEHKPLALVETLVGTNQSARNGMVKRVRSEAELHVSGEVEAAAKLVLPRAQSHQSLAEEQTNLGNHIHPFSNSGSRVPKWNAADAQRVKVAYGNEIVRFRMSNNWGFADLLLEIARRFGIEDMSRFDVKYLDDDSEWVLLTCDEDVEECVEVCRGSQSQTIKLLLQVSSRCLS